MKNIKNIKNKKSDINRELSINVTESMEHSHIKKNNNDKLSVIIYNCNQINNLKKSIESIFKNSSEKKSELLFISNNLVSIQTILNKYENKFDIKLIYSNNILNNINIGINVCKNKYVILLDGNIIVSKNWDIELLSEIRNNENIFGIYSIMNNSNIDIKNISSDDFFKKINNLQNIIGKSTECNYLNMKCACFRKQDLLNISKLDTNYTNLHVQSIDFFELLCKNDNNLYLSTTSIVYNQYTSDEIINFNDIKYFKEKWNKDLNYNYDILLLDEDNKSINKLKDNYISDNKLHEYIYINNKIKYYNFESININHIEIDLYLYKYLYNIKTNICKHIYNTGVLNGYIYSLKQLKNIFNIQNFFKNNNVLYAQIDNYYIELKLLVKSIYDKDYNYYINNIRIINNNLNIITDDIICCFIGNYDIGYKLLNKILKSDKFNLTIVLIFKNDQDYNKLINLVKKFKNYIIFKANEYGNDIIPTLQSVNYMINNYNNIKNIYKFHTKRDCKWFNNCTDFLLNNELKYNNDCNCIGNPKYYKNLNRDYCQINRIKKYYCLYFINKYKHKINKNKFVAGTIFYTDINTYKEVLNIVKENHYSYFVNNTYDNNLVNLKNSPNHFLERLFGCIKK